MSDRAALFAAVCANPEDDTPRLVLADWLEENGEAKRARHIRAAVELHRREAADTPAAAVYGFLADDLDWAAVDADLGGVRAAHAALEKARFLLTPGGEQLPRIRGVTFRVPERGFFTGAAVKKPAAFLANAAAIFRAAPITAIEFKALTPDEAREFVAAGHLARIRRLLFSDDVEPGAIQVIGDHRDAAGVTHLELVGGMDSGGQLEQLTAGTHWTGVTHLALMDLGSDDNGTEPDAGVAALLRRPAFRRLRHFLVWGDDIGDRTARAVATAGLTELRHLDLSINTVGEAGAAALAASKSLPNLRYLDLSMNDFAGEAASALIATPRLPSLTMLRLGGNGVLGPDPKVLAKTSRGPTLRALNLEGGALNTRGVAALAACPAAHGLWFLSLEGCGLSDAGFRALTKSPGFAQLTALDVSGNRLTARSAEALANWSAPLQGLDLSANKIEHAGAKALAASPHAARLRHLGFSGRGRALLLKKLGKKVMP